VAFDVDVAVDVVVATDDMDVDVALEGRQPSCPKSEAAALAAYSPRGERSATARFGCPRREP
ncbi:MAG: hypothetical protein ACKPKO_03210, partial [Candidatus Fonsibacter sp.]